MFLEVVMQIKLKVKNGHHLFHKSVLLYYFENDNAAVEKIIFKSPNQQTKCIGRNKKRHTDPICLIFVINEKYFFMTKILSYKNFTILL